MSTDRRGRLEVPGVSTARRGKLEIPAGCLLREEVSWRYLVYVD